MAPREQQRDEDRRKKVVEEDDVPDSWTKGIPLSPSWWAPTFVTLLIVGLVWLVVFYFTGMRYPIPGFGYWNLGIGIALMMAGFLMTLRWK